jgi:hypothetical protein
MPSLFMLTSFTMKYFVLIAIVSEKKNKNLPLVFCVHVF